MTEASAIRYLLNHGWNMIGDNWFCLTNHYESPVCVETAYQLQKMLEQRTAAA